MTHYPERRKRLGFLLSFLSTMGLLLTACGGTTADTSLKTLLKLDLSRPTFVFFWESG